MNYSDNVIYKKLDYPPKIQASAKGLIRIMGLFNPIIRELAEMMHQFDKPFRVGDVKFQKLFGQLAIPLEQASTATIEWYENYPKR